MGYTITIRTIYYPYNRTISYDAAQGIVMVEVSEQATYRLEATTKGGCTDTVGFTINQYVPPNCGVGIIDFGLGPYISGAQCSGGPQYIPITVGFANWCGGRPLFHHIAKPGRHLSMFGPSPAGKWPG